MQLFLYMCEECQTAKFSVENKGDVYYTGCGGCRCLMFHRQVLVDTIWNIQINCIVKHENKLGFYVEENNGGEKERKVDEH